MAYTLTDIRIPKFNYDLENKTQTATRWVWIDPWSELDAAITDLAGTSNFAGNILLVTNPVTFPGKTWLWLAAIEAQSLLEFLGDSDCLYTADANDLPTDREGAVLVLNYKTPKYDNLEAEQLPDIPTDTVVTVARSQSIEFAVEAKGGGLRYEEGVVYTQPTTHTDYAVPVDASISSTIAIGDIQITWAHVRNPPWATIDLLQGCVNHQTFLGKAVETVMFNGVRDQISYQSDGNVVWQLTYQFNIRIPKWRESSVSASANGPVYNNTLVTGGWNHYPVANAAGTTAEPPWQRVYRKTTTNATVAASSLDDKDLLFQKADLTQLFVPGNN